VGCKGIIFDFDGTLVHLDVDWESVRGALRTLFNQFGVNFDSSSVLGSISKAYDALIQDRRLANRFLYQAREILVQAELVGMDKATLLPGARGILEWLAESGIPVAVVSNNDSHCVRMLFAKFNLLSPLAIIGRDMVSYPKPATEGALFALDILGLESGECWLVGDSSVDVKLGCDLGLRTVFICPPGDEEGKASPGVLVIHNLLQLKAMLGR